MRNLGANALGALIMTGSMAAFTVNDALIKSTSGEMHLFQAIFVRSLVTTCLMLILGLVWGLLRLRLGRRVWLLLLARSTTEVGAAYFFLTALFNMPLANAVAIIQALPLTVTLAGALVLGEPLGWRRMTAILIGFIGVLIIIRPGTDGFSVYSLYVVAAVGFVTIRDLISRRMPGNVPSMMVAFVSSFSVLIYFSAATLTIEWVPMQAKGLGLLSLAGIFVIGGYVFSVSAMRHGDIAVVAPFRYTSILFAILLGVLIFGDWPDGWTYAGTAVVVLSGLFSFYREQKLRRQAGNT